MCSSGEGVQRDSWSPVDYARDRSAGAPRGARGVGQDQTDGETNAPMEEVRDWQQGAAPIRVRLVHLAGDVV